MTLQMRYLYLLLISGGLVALDQATKIFIHTNFRLSESIEVIPQYFQITYVRNLGAAFGILASAPEEFRTAFFLTLPPLAMILILLIMRSTPAHERLQIFALCSIFGGAVGNYIDRLRFGYVVDFLDFHWQHQYSWPAFNVADISIVVGVSILAFFTVVQTVRDLRSSKK